MTDTLGWKIEGHSFRDGSLLADWEKIYQDSTWHWQYDTHEMTFAIYKHDGQYWKLYHARFVQPGADEYSYGFGGQSCRMVEVEYTRRARSTHSHMLMEKGDRQWIRTYEYDPAIMTVITAGEENGKYGAPYTEIRKKQWA
ncbi:hypothetical protein K3555_17830 [Leisingera sp. M527]|uniref:hypothetical protein n=1 Tax=Leisingera sp. M527 TaxID=2867014 RepID=UPI0021A2CD10|nr:hypothetical protein [Leisingera sp. M527]UWQ32379.1 hypothetical protein K3555_17830 [Leisingera sp. M527]